MLENVVSKVLLEPVEATDAGVSGAWVDLQGLINPGGRALKFILVLGAGGTDGTAGGSIQHADGTDGDGAATIGTFGTVSTAAPQAVLHAVAGKRYVRFVGTVEADASMILGAVALGVPRSTA